MKSGSKKQRVSVKDDDTRDRLSELPNDVLVHILSFLPIRDAIRTVQIRRFGDLWTLNPTLRLFCNEERLINNVIKFHKNPNINLFELNLRDGVSQDKLVKWIDCGLRIKTKELKVHSKLKFGLLSLPARVFRSQCLVVLELTELVIKLPRVVSMGSLRTLVLNRVAMNDDTFQFMINGCSCLKELSITDPLFLRKLHFTAPSIETLYLDLLSEYTMKVPLDYTPEPYSLDCPNIKVLRVEQAHLDYLKVVDVSSVHVGTIKDGLYFEDQEDIDARSVKNFEVLLDKFRNAEFFQQENKACHQLNHCGHEFNEKLVNLCNEWTHIALRPGFRGSCLLGIFRLLGNSYKLEELIIYANGDFSCDCDALLVQEVSSSYDMHRLENVSIREYEKPSKTLLQLIEFLLKRSNTLKKLLISCNRKDQLFSTEGQEFILQLLSLPRASKKARIIFA